MRLVLQYFDGCPNWETTKAHLESLNERGYGLTLEYQRIGSSEAAEEHGFRGSPTVLIEGVDPFADPDAPVGLSCRMYVTESGLVGTPSIGQLERALLDHRDTRPV